MYEKHIKRYLQASLTISNICDASFKTVNVFLKVIYSLCIFGAYIYYIYMVVNTYTDMQIKLGLNAWISFYF